MYFADEVRDPADELDQLPTRTKVGGKDLDMAVNLVKAMTSPWDPKNYRDTYTERVQKLIDAKKQNREIVLPEDSEADDAKVVDLLAALQASLDTSKSHKPGNTRNVTKLRTRKADTTATKKTAAKKTAAKKSAAMKSAAKKTAAKKTAAKKSAAKKTTAKKTARRSARRKAS